eukprot:GILK01011738.1.p1 GENE.GILK01011738.1~~GILK01011738.1.p1  ORF type:complete len:743 (-),score=142.08 GILK01011738.1:2773-4923(-)
MEERAAMEESRQIMDKLENDVDVKDSKKDHKKSKKESKKKSKKESKKKSKKDKKKKKSERGGEKEKEKSHSKSDSEEEIGESAIVKPSVGEAMVREDWMLRGSNRKSEVVTTEQSEQQSKPEGYAPSAEGGLWVPNASSRDGAEVRASGSVVGDGGRSWRLKALKRAEERAKEIGRPVLDTTPTDTRGKDNSSAQQGGSRTQATEDRLSADVLDKESYLMGHKQRMQGPSSSTSHTSSATSAWRSRRDDSNRTAQQADEAKWRRSSEAADTGSSQVNFKRFLSKGGSELPSKEPSRGDAEASTLPASTHTTGAGQHGAIEAAPVSQQHTQADINKLAAQVLKAQLIGDNAAFQTLSKQLELAKQTAGSQAPAAQVDSGRSSISTDPNVVVLDSISADGRLRSKLSEVSHTSVDKHKQGRKRGAGDRDKEGRTAFYDDDNVSLDELVRRERVEGVQNYEENFAQNILRSKRFKVDKDTERATDEAEYELHLYESRESKMSAEKRAQHDRTRAINETKKIKSIHDKCNYCMESPRFQKHLVLSMANSVYLSLPSQPIIPGHCLIVPSGHATAVTAVDEEVYEEIRNFMKCLVAMFSAQKKGVIFVETVMQLSQQRHTYLEVYPVANEVADLAPIYFKKAIQESDAEWGTHIQLIDTRGKGVRRALPKSFAYFHVDFDGTGGFAHVIEDERRFKRDFAREVIGGMLELEPEQYLRPKRY